MYLTPWKRALYAALTTIIAISLPGCSGDKNETDDPKEDDNFTKLEEVLAGEIGAEFEVPNTTVIAFNEQGVLLQQGESRIYAFYGDSHGLTTGDIVTVSGTTSIRNGLLQFGKGCTLTKTGHKDFTQPDPEKFSVSDIESYMGAPSVRYVTYSGVILVSGNYTNLEIDGTSVVGSLDYMTDEFKEKYNNHSVTITGWLFGSYKTYLYTISVAVTDNGKYEEDVPAGAIYYNTFDKDIASQTFGDGSKWPFLDEFEGWKNEKGSGVSGVTYDFSSISARTNQSSKGSLSQYDGSGKNNIFFSTAPNHFTIGNIAVPSEKLRLSFGAQRYAQGASNDFIKSDFEVLLSADGETWSPALNYDFGDVQDVAGQWRLATADFTLPAGTKTLFIKFSAKMSSVNRIDDVLLTAGEGGQEIVFGQEIEVPVSTIAEVIASPIDNIYKIEGTTIGIHSKGFLVQDNTGTILVFKKNHGIEVGDKVTVEGATSEYGELKQFGETSEVTKTGTASVSYPQAEEFGASEFTAYASSPSIKYITYTGRLTSYQDNIYQWHYNVTLEGTSVVGSIAYPVNALNITSLVDRDVIVTGYAIGVTGTDTRYLNTMATSIELAEQEEVPDESKALTVKELNARISEMASGASLEGLTAVKGYVAANNEGGALYQVISLVDNTGEAKSGIIIKGNDYTESTLPVGTKVIVSLKYATYDLFKGLPQIKGATIFTTSEKAEIIVPEIDDSQCGDYLGQYVKVKDLTAPEDATTWCVNNKSTTTKFTGAKGNIVASYVTKYAVYKDEKIAHRTADLKGVMEVYGDLYELIPTSMDDVAGFKE